MIGWARSGGCSRSASRVDMRKSYKGLHAIVRNTLGQGDAINAILAGCGFNMAKLVRAAALWVRFLLLGYLLDFDRDEERLLAQAMPAA